MSKIISEYLKVLHETSFVSLGNGGWDTWRAFTEKNGRELSRCSTYATSIDKKVCKFKAKIIDVRRKLAFIRTINCQIAKEPTKCIVSVREHDMKLQMSLRKHTNKLADTIRNA